MDFKTTPFEQFLNSVKKNLVVKDGVTGSDVIKEAVALWTKMGPEERQCYINISSNVNAIKNIKKQQKSSETLNKADLHDTTDSKSETIKHLRHPNLQSKSDVDSKDTTENTIDCVHEKTGVGKQLRRPSLPQSKSDCGVSFDCKSGNRKNNTLPLSRFPHHETNTKNINAHPNPQFKLNCDTQVDSKLDSMNQNPPSISKSQTSKVNLNLQDQHQFKPKTDFDLNSNFKQNILGENTFSVGKPTITVTFKNDNIFKPNLAGFQFTPEEIKKENPFSITKFVKNEKFESISPNGFRSNVSPFDFSSVNPNSNIENCFVTNKPLSAKEAETNFVKHLIDPDIVQVKHMFKDLKVQWQQLNDCKENFRLNQNSITDSTFKNSEQNPFTFIKKKLEQDIRKDGVRLVQSNHIHLKSSPNSDLHFEKNNSRFCPNDASLLQSNHLFNDKAEILHIENSNLIQSSNFPPVANPDCFDFKGLRQILDSFDVDTKCETSPRNKSKKDRRGTRRRFKSKSNPAAVSVNERMLKIKMEKPRNSSLFEIEENNNM